MALQEFIGYVKNTGIARNNRYEVTINAPGVGVSATGKDIKSLFIKSVDIPTLSLMTWEHNVYGEFRTVPYQKRFDPFSITFYVDQKFDVKKMFDTWMSQVFDPETRVSGYYDNYAKNNNLVLDVYNVDEVSPKYSLRFFEVYPKAVQQIQLEASRRDAMTLTVTFNYKYFEVVDTLVNNE